MKNFELASPSEMSARTRAGEITAILAAAIVRTLSTSEPNQRTGATTKPLGFLFDERVHTTPYQQERL